MTESRPAPTAHALRLWPGFVIVALTWLVRFGVPVVFPDATPVSVLGALAGIVSLMVWWAWFSRAPRVERWSAPVAMVLASLATVPLLDISISSSMMGLMFPVYTAPTLALAFVA